MVTLVNRAKMNTSTTGTGTITLGTAEDGYQSFVDAGVTDGDEVRYVIEDGSNWEIGTGTYTASGTTLTRTVLESSNSDSAINLSGAATVFVAAVVGDLPDFINGLGLPAEPVEYTSSDTYTPTTGARYVKITLRGGGGAGGGPNSTGQRSSSGGGGGQGGLLEGVLPTSGLSGVTLTVGAGGAGVNGQAGNAGGDTSWSDGTNTWTAGGGGGGARTKDISNTAASDGGAGGTNTVVGAAVDVNAPGEPGGYGYSVGENTTSFPSAAGGHGGGDGGGETVSAGGTSDSPVGGVSATGNEGAGGGGGVVPSNAQTRSGGDGADGKIILQEFF